MMTHLKFSGYPQDIPVGRRKHHCNISVTFHCCVANHFDTASTNRKIISVLCVDGEWQMANASIIKEKLWGENPI